MELNGREVEDIQVDGVDPRDYPDFCDAYFCSAVWVDTGKFLQDGDLEQLTDENPELLWEMAYESLL